ncbi:MAG: hypothetical protein ACLP9L_22085, partial [Thermoguttaceae bacterium]
GMPRPPRIDFPDAVYHVTSRGNGRADIFYSDDDRRRFLAQLAGSRYAIGGAEFVERTEERIEQRRSGRVQDQDLDLPRRTVSLEEIDEAVARHYRIDSGLFSAHGRRAGVGRAKSVALELAAQLADLTGRAIGEHYGICATAVGANRRRLATRRVAGH